MPLQKDVIVNKAMALIIQIGMEKHSSYEGCFLFV